MGAIASSKRVYCDQLLWLHQAVPRGQQPWPHHIDHQWNQLASCKPICLACFLAFSLLCHEQNLIPSFPTRCVRPLPPANAVMPAINASSMRMERTVSQLHAWDTRRQINTFMAAAEKEVSGLLSQT